MFLCTSDAERADTSVHFPKVEVAVCRPFIELARFGEGPTIGPLDHFRILFLGRLHPIKGIEVLLEACRRIVDAEVRFGLSIVGEGDEDYVSGLRAEVVRLGLSSYVTFCGPVDPSGVLDIISQHHVTAIPSHSENFCQVVLESLSVGVPVVASTGTPWQIVNEWKCGAWVDNSPESFADALLELRDTYSEDLRRRCVLLVREEYSRERFVDEFARFAVEIPAPQ
jgi:glycosyltransferase involved in cell wall biosynthesis